MNCFNTGNPKNPNPRDEPLGVWKFVGAGIVAIVLLLSTAAALAAEKAQTPPVSPAELHQAGEEETMTTTVTNGPATTAARFSIYEKYRSRRNVGPSALTVFFVPTRLWRSLPEDRLSSRPAARLADPGNGNLRRKRADNRATCGRACRRPDSRTGSSALARPV